MPCPRHGDLGISSVHVSTSRSSRLSGTCGFRRVYRSRRPRARDIEPAEPDCAPFSGPSPPLLGQIRMATVAFNSCVISLQNLSLGNGSKWHTRGWFGCRKRPVPFFSRGGTGMCVVRGKPGSRVMPGGRFAELNREVERAESRRVRRSRSGRKRSSGGTR